ncbi:flagellar hook-length control protein FliK [Kushneria phyllosphaerae]|uniref:Flagellar hook-length control protein-like C-terminal domain-containing protein n=1 Tax=Kushneria phyllosphaerae TaxID=2100822 RepID=A0A2R8CPR8_9GAMM|nr:flagellar hook-length control protein FliK [Kushneria phyllosphaerae]SPJ34901.1 hypothetical protein KSP9073_02948 [Kushneria phyllosphaerae]
MSAITPLLDTLLHNVLGRRADLDRVASRQPDLPLGGVTYTPAVRHGTSDTPDETLERHGEDAAARAKSPDRIPARVTPSGSNPFVEDTPSSSLPKSSTTHFSAEARAISRILEKFPATAPVVSTDVVLLADEESPRPLVLSSVLAGQIRHSGLFYESHLRQWLLGQYDSQELLKEPQNRLLQALSTGNQATAEADKAYSALTAVMRERHAAQSAGSLAGREAGTPDMSSAQDDLQGILRHQLELMTSPLVRWEGFLTPQIPVQWEIEQEPEADTDEKREEASRIWRSKLRLTLPALGHVDLEISLQDKTIKVSGRVEGPYLAWMTVQGQHLDERFTGAGLQLAALHFSPQNGNDHEGETA